MEKIKRWIATHRVWVCIISIFIVTAWTIVRWPNEVNGFISFFIIYVGVLSPSVCANRIVNNAIAKLNNECNPYPLLEESEFFLRYWNPKVWKHSFWVNKYCALREMGKYQEAYEGLLAIDREKMKRFPAVSKFIYYNNLADICRLLRKYDEEQVWISKQDEIYAKVRTKSKKKQFQEITYLRVVGELVDKEAYEEALQTLEAIRPKNMRQQVSIHEMYSQIYLKTNDNENARIHLQEIIKKGNCLYAVEVAKERLGTIETYEYF